MSFDREALLAAVQRSPAAVAVHDRAGWVGLFAQAGEINDPVGSRPHVGREAIERFYDTFIAPNTITFHVERDFVCGGSVMRDLTIETAMGGGVVLRVPMHLRYDVVAEGAALKIGRLFAHWELPFMIGQLLKTGPKGWWLSLLLGPRLVAHQGFGGVLGFMRGFFTVGAHGKRTARAFLDALGRGDGSAAEALLAPGAKIEWPFGTPCSIGDMAGIAAGLHCGKTLASGRYVTASLEAHAGAKWSRGVAVLRFADGADRIASAQFFADA